MRIVMLDRQRPLSVQEPAPAARSGPAVPPGVRGGPYSLGTPPSPPTAHPSAAQGAPPRRRRSVRSSVVATKKLPVQKRKEVFLALVAAQDTHTMSVADTQRQ